MFRQIPGGPVFETVRRIDLGRLREEVRTVMELADEAAKDIENDRAHIMEEQAQLSAFVEQSGIDPQHAGVLENEVGAGIMNDGRYRVFVGVVGDRATCMEFAKAVKPLVEKAKGGQIE